MALLFIYEPQKWVTIDSSSRVGFWLIKRYMQNIEENWLMTFDLCWVDSIFTQIHRFVFMYVCVHTHVLNPQKARQRDIHTHTHASLRSSCTADLWTYTYIHIQTNVIHDSRKEKGLNQRVIHKSLLETEQVFIAHTQTRSKKRYGEFQTKNLWITVHFLVFHYWFLYEDKLLVYVTYMYHCTCVHRARDSTK